MVLRCSLLGHDFGDTDVDREREERGSEVVVTVQEYEECSRCGQRNVISENTEVTSLSTGTDADSLPDDYDPQPTESPLERDAVADSAADLDSDAAFIDADDSASDDAELVDAGPDAPDSPAGSATDPADAAAADAADAADTTDVDADSADAADDIELPTDENGDPVTDDGEILEDDDDDPAADRDREHGEWPDSSDVGPPVSADADPTEWPDDGDGEIITENDDTEVDSNTGDDGPDLSPPDDDAVVLENDTSTGTASDARSVTAEAPAADRGDAAADAASKPGSGIERANSVSAPAESDSGPASDVPTEFYCPRCDYVAAGNHGSLRAGDICPDCRKGYLSERERQ